MKVGSAKSEHLNLPGGSGTKAEIGMGDCISNPPAALLVGMNETLRSFLSSAAVDSTLSADLRCSAAALSSETSVPFRPLRALWLASSPSTRPRLSCLLSGSELSFPSPRPREKSEELKARLRKLADLAECKAYQELMKDIAPMKGVDEPFSSYKDQLGFGAHVVLIMFTCYLVGYTAFKALFGQSAVMNTAGGLIGLVFGLLLETLLFIIRTSNHDRQSTSTASKQKKDS